MLDRILVCIGGGEIKSKTTLKIDEYISNVVKSRTNGRRPMGLFIGTASHDSMPYFNSFRKTYTSHFDIKADCALMVYGEMNFEKIADKIGRADLIYVGGGDTLFMLKKWRELGIDKLIIDAYKKGTVLCGLSAGAICWFKTMFTDSQSLCNGNQYNFYPGLGLINGACSPHYNLRADDLFNELSKNIVNSIYGIDDNAALVFTNESLGGALSCGGAAYEIKYFNGNCEKKSIPIINNA